MLLFTSDSSVRDHSETVAEESEEIPQEGDEGTETETAANEMGSLPLGVLGGCEVGEEGQRRLNEEFEEAFSSEQFDESMPQFPGDGGREREGRNRSDPRMLDPSSESLSVSALKIS